MKKKIGGNYEKKVHPVMASTMSEDSISTILSKIDDIVKSYDLKSISRALYDLEDILRYDCMDVSSYDVDDIVDRLRADSNLIHIITACKFIYSGWEDNLLSKGR